MLLTDVLDHSARRSPDRPALVFDGRSWSYAELRARVAGLAAGLLGIAAPGDRIAVLAENRPAYVELLYAVPAAGMRCAPVNHRLHPEEWARTLAATGATVCFGDPDLLARLEPHRGDLPALRELRDLDDAAAWERLVRSEEPGPPRAPEPDDVAWILSTSGTTGTPKGAMLTHRSLLAAMTNAALSRPVRSGDVFLFPFPLCHVAAYNVGIHHLHACPVVLQRRFEAAETLAMIERHRVTSVSLAPTMIDMLTTHPALGATDLASLRLVGYGASGIPAPVLRRAAERLGCGFAQGYGMTELSGNAVFLDEEDHRRAIAGDERLLRAAGRAGPLAAVRVLADDGCDAPAGEPGEIVVRGDQVMAGYWGDPGATAGVVEDGWLRTGDLGRLDADGLLTVLDRKKDVIVTGGENVASREVEEVLLTHPGVREVAVVGVPDERWGENVCAVVVRGSDCEADALVEHVRLHLAGYKKPKHVVFVDELPKTASGKVHKAEVRRTARERIGQAPA